MPGRPYILAETTWKTVKATDYAVAVLPWGATEAHNYHLPYNTDVAQCDYVAAESARIAWEAGTKVMVLPTVPFGVNTGQLDIPFDLNMNPSTQAALLGDLAHALAQQGLRRLVVLNGHGGNNFRQMIREVGAREPRLFICTLNWYDAADWEPFFDDLGEHAGELETSAMMHIAPEWVLPLEEAGDGKAKTFKPYGLRDGWVWAERPWTKVTADTGVGDPKAATAEKGARFLEVVTQNIARFLTDLAATDPDDLFEPSDD